MRSKLFIMSISVLVLLPFIVFGQQGATVKGTVTDEGGYPLPGANVYIQDTNYGAATDIHGAFTFNVPAAMVRGQEVLLIVKFIGFKSASASITLSPGEITHDFTLETDPRGGDTQSKWGRPLNYDLPIK